MCYSFGNKVPLPSLCSACAYCHVDGLQLGSELPYHPPCAGEYLDYLVQQAMGTMEAEGKEGQEGAGGLLGQLRRTVNSLNYFMRSLSK